MAADPTVIDRIADALDIKYRRYFRDGTGGARLTFEERRLLDAVRANPSSGQMLALTPYLRDAGQGTETEENALYNVGVALGVRDREIKSVWDRISNLGSDFVTTKPLGDDYNYPSDVPPVPGEPAAGRLPGGGEAERSPVVDAIIDLMGEEFRKWYGGRESGLSVADRKRAAEALANPSNPDLQALAKFSVYPSNMPNREIAFMQAARDMAGPVRTSVAQEEQQLAGVVETLSETRVAYYDPDLGRAVYLAPREAREQGLSRVVTPEPAVGEPAAPAAAPPSETMVSVYNPQTSTVERMTAQDAIDLGLMTREEVSALYSAGVGVSGVATGMGGVPAGGDGAPSGGLGGVAGGVVPPAEDVMLPEDWEKAAEEQYGAYWAIFKYNPELKQILLDATMNDWSDDKFRAALNKPTGGKPPPNRHASSTWKKPPTRQPSKQKLTTAQQNYNKSHAPKVSPSPNKQRHKSHATAFEAAGTTKPTQQPSPPKRSKAPPVCRNCAPEKSARTFEKWQHRTGSVLATPKSTVTSTSSLSVKNQTCRLKARCASTRKCCTQLYLTRSTPAAHSQTSSHRTGQKPQLSSNSSQIRSISWTANIWLRSQKQTTRVSSR